MNKIQKIIAFDLKHNNIRKNECEYCIHIEKCKKIQVYNFHEKWFEWMNKKMCIKEKYNSKYYKIFIQENDLLIWMFWKNHY